MTSLLSLDILLDYTEWDRRQWHAWLKEGREDLLRVPLGPHGDGRFQTAGDLVRHIFSAEKRYVERLSGLPLSDPAAVPSDSLEALFEFGGRSRAALRAFVRDLPAERWERPETLQLGQHGLSATPRKIVVHVVLHEIRHWAQLATLLRLNGAAPGFRDFLFSPLLDPDRPSPRSG